MFDLDDVSNVQDVLKHLVDAHKLTVMLDELSQVCFIRCEALREGGDPDEAEAWANAGRLIAAVPVPAGQ